MGNSMRLLTQSADSVGIVFSCLNELSRRPWGLFKDKCLAGEGSLRKKKTQVRDLLSNGCLVNKISARYE